MHASRRSVGRARWLGLVAVMGGAVALAACSSNTASPSTTTPATSPTSGPITTMPTETATGGEFLSPSANISCQLTYKAPGQTDAAYCQTMTPPRSVTMATDGSYKTCTGVKCIGNPGTDTPTLAYGQATGIGPFLCLSASSGVTCTVSGQGFKIAISGITPVSRA
jgi:hypothetical protein